MIDTAVLWVRAEANMRAGRYADALVHLRHLVEVVDRIDFEYEEWLRAMAECLRVLGHGREAMACAAYLRATEEPPAELLAHEAVRVQTGDPEALRGVRLMGIYLARAGHARAAADWFGLGEMPVHRAIELERAGDDAVAATLWQDITARDELHERPYESALAKINYGLCLLRLGHERSQAALASATTAVEEVADLFETEGLRERAFDCYQLIARIGSETQAFENVAEGYLNSVRILRDDGLKLDALRLHEAFVSIARRSGEWHAAAGILREAADYCTRAGMPYGDDLRLRSAEAWLKAGVEAQSAGHPMQIVENAYLAAAEAFASVRAFKQVLEVYRRLLQLELSGRARERYRRLCDRLGNDLQDAPRPVPVPEFLKQLPEYEEVWYVDLAEWELEGDPALIAAGVMADRRFPDFVRRHALLLVLELERRGSAVAPVDVARRLEAIRAYPVIAALEALFDHGDVPIRRAVAEAMGKLRFKRSFTLIGRALRDDEPEVREAAATATAQLVFPHAFEPLRRIFAARDLPDGDNARRAALKAIGKINTVEALEFLCDRLREGDRNFVEPAAHLLGELTNAELLPYLRHQIELVPVAYRAALEDTARRLERRLR
ncbi:MAG: HEAT repeat domain-containing protein [Deltaproteobacteria bacterium]|nr:HEAT repeat domain-containing protein [Deltaproteobacteria bacterium]MBP7289742.1 HEAT repeat domain-containing protein [Nannocystaceae bacterium]